MKEYVKLIMGLISGFSLMLLNNDIVFGTINIVLRGFNVNNINTFTNILTSIFSIIVIILSFIGIFITIISSILILKKVIRNRDL